MSLDGEITSKAPTVMADKPRAYKLAEACEILRCSRSKFYGLVNKGLITPTKVGGRVLVLSREIDRVLGDTQEEA